MEKERRKRDQVAHGEVEGGQFFTVAAGSWIRAATTCHGGWSWRGVAGQLRHPREEEGAKATSCCFVAERLCRRQRQRRSVPLAVPRYVL